MDEIKRNREFMMCPNFDDGPESDQDKGMPHPPLGKTTAGELIELPPFDETVPRASYTDVLNIRRSERVYSDEPMTREQLAFILWSAQGIQEFRGANGHASFRPAPSGGARHPFELYIAIRNVEGLKAGLYHYAPMEHVGEKRVAIEYLGPIDRQEERVTEMVAGQKWASKAAVVLLFSCVPYRAEWRYREFAHRVMLIDLGHVGQNTMLSAAALGLGSCCIAAYDQKQCDQVLGCNGVDEYTVYVIPAGPIRHKG